MELRNGKKIHVAATQQVNPTVASTPPPTPPPSVAPATPGSTVNMARLGLRVAGIGHFDPQTVSSSSDSEEEGARTGFALVSNVPQNNNNGMNAPAPEQRVFLETPSVAVPNRQHNTMTEGQRQQPQVYYRYYAPNPPQPARSGGMKYVMVPIVVALIAYFCPDHVPPAPHAATGAETWEELASDIASLSQELTTKVGIGSIHLVTSVAESMVDGVTEKMHNWQKTQGENKEMELWANCSLEIPNVWDLEYGHHNSSNQPDYYYYMVDQSRAVTVATSALDAWTKTSPLMLYFAGSYGVGKSELARQISLRLFGHCLGSAKGPSREDLLQGTRSPFMTLQGRDFAEGRVTQVQLYENIVRHAQQHPLGSVVVLEGAEEMADGILNSLVQDMTAPSKYTSTENDKAIGAYAYDTTQSLASRLLQACGKTVFIVTSLVGKETIGKYIELSHGIDNIEIGAMDLDMMYALDKYYAKAGKSGTAKLMGSKIHAVSTFYPLQLKSLRQILVQKASQFRPSPTAGHLIFTTEAIDTFLRKSGVEYKVLAKNEDPFFVHSTTGGHELTEGSKSMNYWLATLKRCFQAENTGSNGDGDTRVRATTDNVVLDFDAATYQTLILICPRDAIHTSEDEDIFMSTVTRHQCEEKCSSILKL